MSATAKLPGAKARAEPGFALEVARLKASGVLGASGRLAELFDFLAARGPAAEPVSQAEIAESVFGQSASETDDATVRVYIHRLRKRLDDFYASGEQGGADRLKIPPGSYALRFEAAPRSVKLALRRRWTMPVLAAVALALIAGAFLAGRMGQANHVPVNPLWAPFLASDRPIVVVVGDYYIYGEIDPKDPEDGRLIRDFNINSKTDLARAQEANPARYDKSEDMGLNYLPVSSAYALADLMPILSQHGHPVTIVASSQVTSDTFQTSNVVYVGLVSAMGLLEDVNFMSSGYAVGENYDELIDMGSRRSYISEEAMRLPSAQYYRDYGYFSEFRGPGGGLVAVVAGTRDTGLRGLSPIVGGSALPTSLDRLAQTRGGPGFEALFEITGQQGAALSHRVIAARKRP